MGAAIPAVWRGDKAIGKDIDAPGEACSPLMWATGGDVDLTAWKDCQKGVIVAVAGVSSAPARVVWRLAHEARRR